MPTTTTTLLGPQNPTYYEILSLSPTALTAQEETAGPDATAALIKRAYRRALLNHHPDKNTTASRSSSSPYTIDQISTAYATLSRPAQRQAYDLLLQSQIQQGAGARGLKGEAEFQTGIETVDLDDLNYDDENDSNPTRWYRSCRCGNPRGYQFAEADLEEAADLGELMVGCADCSLWLRVHFAVMDDDEDDGASGEEQQNRDGSGTKGSEDGGRDVGAGDGAGNR